MSYVRQQRVHRLFLLLGLCAVISLIVVARCSKEELRRLGNEPSFLEVYALQDSPSSTASTPVQWASDTLYREDVPALTLYECELSGVESVGWPEGTWSIRYPIASDQKSRFQRWGKARVGKLAGAFVDGEPIMVEKISHEWGGDYIYIHGLSEKEAEQLVERSLRLAGNEP